jgi:carbonic anhydrase
MEIPDRILSGLKSFQRHVYPKHRDLFQELALGQRPETLFITCADSRIDPCLLTQSKPGDLFICRVIGNVVPRHPSMMGGVSATIEYAVAVLRVTDVVVCGHTDCGVMKASLDGGVLQGLPNVTAWLKHVEFARRAVVKSKVPMDDAKRLLAITERNVVEQLRSLRGHPSVASRLDEGDLKLHGWVYHLAEGIVTAFDAEQDRFLPINERSKTTRAESKAAPKGEKLATR